MRTFYKYAVAFSIFFIVYASIQAQDVTNYLLLPGPTFTLPVGENIDLKIFYVDDALHYGTKSVVQAPEWFINGQPIAAKQDPLQGYLASDLNSSKVIYTAPEKLPKTNPVTISVRFHPTDDSKELITLICNITVIDPGNQWYVAFIYTNSNKQSDNSATEQHTNSSYAQGSASMLIKGTPPEKDGHVTINTEYDTIVSYKAFGSCFQNRLNISNDINGSLVEKTMSTLNGSINHDERDGIEFEYDPSKDGIKQLGAAGLTFTENGKDQMWRRNENNQVIKTESEVVDQRRNIVFGSSSDIVKKTKNGFTIDGTQKKDTSNTDILGMKHQAVSEIEYHVIISRRPIRKE